MAKKPDLIPKDNNIIKISLEEAMPDNYLPYAVEVAKERALPDVRDGLKPVHRRIIYGAHMLRAYPDKPYYKSARIVGDILGKYHPHGDTSVYDSMVILAQNFSTRMPLIDGHGNWGSQDGDGAAAMRYTEARLTPIAMEMIRDIDKDVVNMVDNYSGSEKEPEVLPAKYPNLLVNGTFGIAVGLATNIPPHNLREVIDATLALIDDSEITTEGLMKYVKGPDLPTGGVIIGKNSLLSAYENGEGRVTLRAKAYIEKLESGRYGIVITEFPYRKSKAKLLQNISDMTADKRHAKALEGISDIRDESDRTGIRSVIEFKKNVDFEGADKVLKYLYKKTELQSNISFNMVAIADGKPETLGLKPILNYYVKHQKEVIRRRTQRELDIAEKRFHIVQGFIRAIDIMDEIIATIRGSKSKKDALENLISKFGFTALQGEAILELMLYKLTGLEIKVFEKEYKELEKEIKKLTRILKEEKELLKVIKSELEEVKEKYGDDRRSQIVENDEEAKINLEEIMVEEDIIITMSNDGFVKRVPLKTYNRLNSDTSDIEYREGDFNKYLIQSNTKDTILIFTDKGNMYQLKGIGIPEYKWKDKGERIDELIKSLDLSEENIINVISIQDFSKENNLMFITSLGGIKKSSLDKFITNYTKLVALKLKNDEKLLKVELVNYDREEKAVNIETLKGLKFNVSEPKIDEEDRNILPHSLVNLTLGDEIIKAEFVEEFIYSEFTVNINKSNIRILPSNKTLTGLNEKIDTTSILLLMDDTGNAYKIPGFILYALDENQKPLSEIIDIQNNSKIVYMKNLKNVNEEDFMVITTKMGLIRMSKMKELYGEYSKIQAYKLKFDEDKIINCHLVKGTEEIVVITNKAMSIRFMLETINPTGRISSGVTAISLRDEDEAIYSAVVTENTEGVVELTSTLNKEKSVELSNIKLQNRAGRGNSLMLLEIEESLKKVNLKNI